MKTRLYAHFALLAVALIYGANYLIAKQVMNGDFIGPLGFVLLRGIAATLLFWLFTRFRTTDVIARKDWPRLVLCAITGVVVNQTFFFSGLELTTPIHASLIMTINPVMVLIFSFLLIGERITKLKVSGIFMGCTGAILLIIAGGTVISGRASFLGDLLVFVNASSYAIYLVLVKKLTAEYSPITVIKYVFTIGLVFLVPIGFRQLAAVDWTIFTPAIWLAVAYVLFFVTFLAYLLNIFALGHVNPSTVSIYIYLQPLFAAFLSVIAGMETIDAVKVVAAILIFSGVFLVSDFGEKTLLSGEKGRNS